MHRLTRQRLSERLARLEEAVARPSSDEILLDGIHRLAQSGELGDGYAADWSEYRAVCAAVKARGERPPDDYMPERPDQYRVHYWQELRHPDLQPSIVAMLRIFGDHMPQQPAR